MDPWWISFFVGISIFVFVLAAAAITNHLRGPMHLASQKDHERRQRFADDKKWDASTWCFVFFVVLSVTLLFAVPVIQIGPTLLGFFTTSMATLVVVFIRARRSQNFMVDLINRINDPTQVADVLRETENEIFGRGENAQRLNLLGICLGKLDRHEEALDAYRRACELQPTTNHKLGVAIMLSKLGHTAEADAIFAELAAKPDATLMVYCAYADALAKSGRVDEARVQLGIAENLFTPYAKKQISEKAGWTRLINETRQAIAIAENERVNEIAP
jgi:Flp pilus assembly protein TadD